MPLRWYSEPDVQVFSTMDEDATEVMVNALREEFDVDTSLEKIAVTDNGRRVYFVHDFDKNLTG